MKRSDKALDYYSRGFNCAQSVVASFADILNFDEETCLRIASGFGGGIGGMQKICGAITGASLIIGFLRGKYKVGDDEAKEITNNLIQEFTRKFVELNGSINCENLIKYDISTVEGREQAEKPNVFNNKCSNFVILAVNILEETLNSEQ